MDEVKVAQWYFTVEGFDDGTVAVTKKMVGEEETVELFDDDSSEAKQFKMLSKMMGSLA
jgi:hypothetical protein